MQLVRQDATQLWKPKRFEHFHNFPCLVFPHRPTPHHTIIRLLSDFSADKDDGKSCSLEKNEDYKRSEMDGRNRFFVSLSFVVFQASKNDDDYQKSLESFRVKLFSVLPYSRAEEEKKTIYTIISHTHPFHVGAPPNNRQQKGKIFHWSKEKAATTRAKVFEEMEMILVIVFYAVENGILAQLFGLVLIKIYCEPESAVCAGSYVFWDTIFIIDRKTCRKWDFSVLL